MNYLNRLPAVILSVCGIGIGLLQPPGAEAQFTQQFSLQNSPEYEAEATRLRGAPPREYDFSKALLSDVLRFLADDAGISFFGLPEGSANSDRLVTFSLRTSPFTALETLAKANGIALIHDNGLWYLRPADDTELIGRVYQINYNSQELVSKSSSSSGGGISGGSSSSGEGSGGGLSLQGAPNTFEREPSKLIDDIKEILNLPTNSRFASIAPTTSVDTFGQLSAAGFQSRQNVVAPVGGGAGEAAASGSGGGSEPVARVIWSSDSNSLYVVATRQQHQWIEGYLASADQEQALIAVEVKFFESNSDPRTELGLDWTGTLAGGYGVNLAVPPSAIDLNRVKDYRLPTTAVLSYDDVNVRLRALVNDRNTRTVSYPRMLTLDNREVVFRSVINQPVLASSSASSLGAGATETTAVDYLPIGTVINILPKRMANDNILLNISIELSQIIGEEIINGNPFPIATSRVYGAPVQVESGYTVAISGLDEAEDINAEEGVPFLRRIPVLGYLFKTRTEGSGRKHLMMFITPTALDTNDEGVTEAPISKGPFDPATGPSTANFDPTILQFADSARPVPARSRRNDYPDSRGTSRSSLPADPPALAPQLPTAPTPAIDSSTTDFGDRALVLAAPSRDEYQAQRAAVKANATPAPAPAVAPVPAPAPTPSITTTPMDSIAEAKPEPEPASKLEPEPTPQVEAEVKAEGPIAIVTPAGSDFHAPAPAAPAKPARAATAPVPAPAKLARSSASPASPSAPSPASSGIEWDGDQLKGGPGAIDDAMLTLRSELSELNSADLDTPSLRTESRIAAVQKDSQRLIDYVESRKHHDPNAFEALNQTWWDLVKINGQSKKLRQSAIDASGMAATDPALSTGD